MRTKTVLLLPLFGLSILGACTDDGTLGGGGDPAPSSSGSSSGTSGTPGTSSGDNGRADEVLTGSITADRTLTADKNYVLSGLVMVTAGATLTIEKGVVLKGENATKGILLVQPGGKIRAMGTADEPIVFTSQANDADKKPGQWGGVILLGNAPTNLKDASGNVIKGSIEGIAESEGTKYGGTDENDSSGEMHYVRIEYSGIVIGDANEVNGLTFGGVGRGTKVDHIQVRQTLDDCFEFFGGTVDAKYLACQHNEDDGFDFDFGYRGRLQFLVLQQDPTHETDDNGIESDNNADGTAAEPLTSPTVYNATLIGKNKSLAGQQYGLLLRKNTRGTYKNLVVMGFQAAVDLRNDVGDLSLTNSLVWGSTGAGAFAVTDHIAFVEDKNTIPQGGDEKVVKALPDWADDKADEVAWFKGAVGNRVADPLIAGAFSATAPVFGPSTTLGTDAATPPNDGFFDVGASYLGAFKDANDTWATTGKWAVWLDR